MKSIVLGIILLACVRMEASDSALDRSFHHMYNLRFADAEVEASAFNKTNPADPLGDIAFASAILFSEFERLQILQSELFASDINFDSRPKRELDAKRRLEFENRLQSASTKARNLLLRDPQNREALFALALANGLRANYAALIEKRNFAALRSTKTATEYAERLLTNSPQFYDAYLAIGMGKYLVGMKPAPVRWLLRLGGVKGDVDEGMRDLAITAEKGRFLAPFARLLLAVGYIRKENRPEAKKILLGLATEFPSNPLYRREADLLKE
jgi:hypothetical protein